MNMHMILALLSRNQGAVLICSKQLSECVLHRRVQLETIQVRRLTKAATC
jgi:hypothetical protein